MRIRDDIEAGLAAQKKHLLLWAPVFFGIGIGWYFAWRSEPLVWFTIGMLAVAAGLCAAIIRRRFLNIWWQIAWLSSLALLLIATGFADTQIRASMHGTTMLARTIGPVGITGIVDALEDEGPSEGTQVTLSQVKIEWLEPNETPARIRLKIRAANIASANADDFVPEEALSPAVLTALHPGDRIRALARMSPPAAPSSPGAFDFQRYAWFKQLGAFGFVYGTPMVLSSTAPNGFGQWLEAIRQRIATHIDAAMNEPASGIAKTLIVQARGSIAPDDAAAMRAAGLAHLLAIAGLHLSIVAGFIFFTVRFVLALLPNFALHRPIKKYAAAAAFIGALIYTLLAGAPVPTMRAMIMSGFVLLAILLDRLAISARLVAIAALVILLIEPEVLTGPSFQLSFAAVTALIVIYDRLTPWWTKQFSQASFAKRAGLYFLGICLTTLIASVATAPFAVYQFQTLNPYGILGNLLAISLMAYWVMPAAVVACIAMPFGLDYWPLRVMAHGILPILHIAHWVYNLPHSTLALPALPVSVLVMIVFAGLIVLFWRGRGVWTAVVPLCVAIILIVQYRPPDILVSNDAKLMAIRDRAGIYHLSSRQSDRYTATDWLRRNGQTAEGLERWPTEGAALDGELLCAEGGCHFTRNNRKIAFDFLTTAQNEDCAWADILIAADPVQGPLCRAPVVIDRFTVWREGAMAVWLDGQIESVNGERGKGRG